VLSQDAQFILDRMEPGRRYEPPDLRPFVPDASSERLRAIMHELWIDRQVERIGHGGWRLVRSAPPHQRATAPGDSTPVKPEELFDHATFADFFK